MLEVLLILKLNLLNVLVSFILFDLSTDAIVGGDNLVPHVSFFCQECDFLREFSLLLNVSLVSEDGFSLLNVLFGPFAEVVVSVSGGGLHSLLVGEDVLEGAVVGVDVTELELEGFVSIFDGGIVFSAVEVEHHIQLVGVGDVSEESDEVLEELAAIGTETSLEVPVDNHVVLDLNCLS